MKNQDAAAAANDDDDNDEPRALGMDTHPYGYGKCYNLDLEVCFYLVLKQPLHHHTDCTLGCYTNMRIHNTWVIHTEYGLAVMLMRSTPSSTITAGLRWGSCRGLL